jgi:hypothetical protein
MKMLLAALSVEKSLRGPLGVGPTDQHAESDHNSGPANALQVALLALRGAAAFSKGVPDDFRYSKLAHMPPHLPQKTPYFS